MFKHLLKLVWNRKKRNFLLLFEILFSFFVMFAIFTFLVYYYQNYSMASGFDYEHVWSMNYLPPRDIGSADSLGNFRESVKKTIRSMPQVEAVTFTSNNTPFSNGGFAYHTDLSYKNRTEEADQYMVDENYKDVLHITMQSGQWLASEDSARKESMVVINEALKKRLFGDEEAEGKLITVNNRSMKIKGVVQDFKDKGNYLRPDKSIFTAYMDSGSYMAPAIMLKVKAEAGADFEDHLYKALTKLLGNADVNIEHLDVKREHKDNFTLVPLIIGLIVAGFFIINIGLGFFGVLWFNIIIRRGEIGLRRAVGADGATIAGQMTGEALLLSTLALLIGSFFAIQFPLLNVFDLPASTYLIALLLTILFIYALTILCAAYPAKQSAAIYPAIALREE